MWTCSLSRLHVVQVIRQIDWREITPENMHRQASIRRLIPLTDHVPRLGGRVRARTIEPAR